MTFRHDPFPKLPIPTTVNPEDISNLGNVTIRGDIRSYAWDGGGSLEGGADADATGGYLLDSSEGSAQFKGSLFLGGTLTVSGSATVSGTLTVSGSGTFSGSLTVSGSLTLSGSLVASGDIYSTNWNGATPANLTSTRDPTADKGFYFDGSAGAAQFEGTLYMGNQDQIQFKSGGVNLINTAESGAGRITIDQYAISFVNSGGTVLSTWGAGTAGAAPRFYFPDGSLSALSASFLTDQGTGFFRGATNQVNFVAGGVTQFHYNASNAGSPVIGNNTTGSAANMFIESTGSRIMFRSTSALKYKSRITTNVGYLADIDLIPTKHYRKDDGRWRYSLIADWLGDQDPLLGDYGDEGIEDYDVRGVLAVMAAKINRLEKELANA
jgi:hypothetical protein